MRAPAGRWREAAASEPPRPRTKPERRKRCVPTSSACAAVTISTSPSAAIRARALAPERAASGDTEESAPPRSLTSSTLLRSLREIGVVAVGRFVGLPGATALAAALAAGDRNRDLLLEARRPDQLATEPRTTVEARDRRALGGGEPVDLLQARPFDDLVAAGATEPGLVYRRTGQSAQRLPDRAAGRAAERGTQRRARDLEKKRRHQSVTPGKEKAWLR